MQVLAAAGFMGNTGSATVVRLPDDAQKTGNNPAKATRRPRWFTATAAQRIDAACGCARVSATGFAIKTVALQKGRPV
jgi:hypothetical protein